MVGRWKRLLVAGGVAAILVVGLQPLASAEESAPPEKGREGMARCEEMMNDPGMARMHEGMMGDEDKSGG